MSRAQETRIFQESQRVFNFIKTVAKIVVAVSVVVIIYSVATYRDSDKKAIKAIFQEQMKKEIEEEMAPHRKRIEELEEKFSKSRLSDAEIKELEWLLVKTAETKKTIRAKYEGGSIRQPTQATQIYPNYDFPEGVNQITVPLIPANQVLSREAGGWVITPAGSGGRIDYDKDVVIEYNDGRKFVRRPGKPAHDGVRPGNGIFRLYGDGEAVVTIHRDVYVNR
ncbi:MAG: hypothetical protein AAB498_01685 [Patescibacteria group bacterium]